MTPKPRTKHQHRIVEILQAGPIEDSNGQATPILLAQTGHRTTQALSGVLAQMEREGLIIREVYGRRTYRIALATSVQPARVATVTSAISDVDRELVELRVENAELRRRLERQEVVIFNQSIALNAQRAS